MLCAFKIKGWLFGALLLSACGFTPIYYTPEGDVSIQQKTAEIQIARVPEQEGRELVQALKNKLNPDNLSVPKQYELSIRLESTLNKDQGILEDNTATRATLTLRAFYQLKNRKTEAIVINDSAFAMSSYNILTAPYATVSAEQATRQRLIKILADQISLRMANYFKIQEDK